MAQTKLVEPYVRVDERIRAYPTMLNIDGTSNIGGVIVAPTGPRIAFISGPKDFLETYTLDGEVPRNADRTFINAYYLSFSAGLVIARSMNTTAVNGLYFSPSASYECKLLLNADNESLWCLAVNGVLYWCNNGDTVWSDFVDLLKSLVDDNGNALVDATKLNTIKQYGTDNKQVSCSDFNELAAALEAAISGSTCIYSDRVSGIIITSTEEVGISVANNILINYELSTPTSTNSFEAHNLNFKDGVALTETEWIQLNFGDTKVTGNWAFVYGNMAYYHGAVDKSKYEDYSLKSVSNLDDVASSISGISGMTAEVVSYKASDAEAGLFYIKVNYSKGNQLFLASEDSGLNIGVVVKQGINNDSSDEAMDFLADSVNSEFTDYENKIFAVYPKDPQDSNKFKMMIQADQGDLFLLTLSDGDTMESYTVSLMADALDQSGSNAFIENLNALGLNYTFITNPDFKFTEGDEEYEGELAIQKVTPKATQIFSFGDSGLDLSASKRVANMINALYALQDQEIYDIEYLAPMGTVDLQFIKNYILVGKTNDWFTPVDIPFDKTNANSIKGYFLNVDLTSNAIGMGPFDKNVGLTGWMNHIACSTLYYTKIMANRAAGKEYAPCFDLTNGVLDFTNPVYQLGKEDRTAMLNFKAPVNFVVYNQRNQVYYLNDNWTHQFERNIVSEEQNRRMINRIKKDCKRLLQSFKGRLNTVSTRSDVVSTLTYYFNSQIMSQQYKPNEFQIVCDESNNPVEVITANKLAVTVRVRLENAIKYIDVLVDVFPLGVDFSS